MTALAPSPYKQKIIRRFADGAATYDANALLQDRVAETVAQRLPATLPARARILEIGCGTGLLSARLAARYPKASLIVTDLSPTMVQSCLERLPPRTVPVEGRIMDGESPDLDGSFDLIVSSMTFHWFDDVPRALARLKKMLTPQGVLAFSALAHGSFAQWQDSLRDAGHARPTFQGVAEHSVAPHLARYKIEEESRVFASAWEFLSSLRAIGAQTACDVNTVVSPTVLARAMRIFETDHQSRITYRVLYGEVSA